MSRTIDVTGDIETVCKAHPVKAGDTVSLHFIADDEATPPFTIRIKSPTGAVVLERVLRELPTSKPQSAPPVQFPTSVPGDYKIEVWQLYGTQRGDATLHVK